MIWNKCPITNKNSKISSNYGIKDKNLHTGVDIEYTGSVLSICEGVVLFVGQSFNMKGITVVIQYSTTQCVRYSNLSECFVSSGSTVQRAVVIGECEGSIHFEYLTTSASEVPECVRIGSVTYYRHDPQCIIDGSVLLSDSGIDKLTIVTESTELPDVEMTPAMEDEFGGNNRGEILEQF